MKLFSLISKFYWHVIASPEKEAKHLGVTIGNHCLISTRYWSSEPYLITIGNYVQVTDPETVKYLQRILDLLDEDDDVQAVYHNWEEPEE